MTGNLARALFRWALLISTLACSAAVAQSSSSPFLSISRSDACLRHAAVAAEVRAYLHRLPAPDVGVELDPGPPITFTVRRSGQPLGERIFEQLPSDCTARRSAVALAMAVSLEHLGLAQLSLAKSHRAADTNTLVGGAERTAPSQHRSHRNSGKNAHKDQHKDQHKDDHEDVDTHATRASSPSKARRGPPVVEQEHNPESSTRAQSAPSLLSGPAPTPALSEPPELEQQRVLKVGIALGAGVLFQVQPGPAPVLQLSTEVWDEPLAFDLAALWSPALEHDWEAVNGSTVGAEAVGGRLSVCLGDAYALLRLEGCGGVLAAALFTSGRGFTSDDSATTLLLGLTVGIRARLPAASPLAVRLRLDAQSNLVRPELRVGGSTPSATPLGVVGAAAIVEMHVLAP